jgi:hypothetical protein
MQSKLSELLIRQNAANAMFSGLGVNSTFQRGLSAAPAVPDVGQEARAA